MNNSNENAFKSVVLDYYTAYGRHDLPWRIPDKNGLFDPYKILVSEIMLQQTQVNRVIEKFNTFMQLFPTVDDLAKAPLADVLVAWSGLGYYRRAKFLHQAAHCILNEFSGKIPELQTELVRLPGVGVNTAGAIIAYSYDKPVVFIETNIRTVFLHHFFNKQANVSDVALLPLIERSVPAEGVREWYWALMDYGSYLKTSVENPSRKSKHHTKQSTFSGSRRQARGQVLRMLVQGSATFDDIAMQVEHPELQTILEDLVREGMISVAGATYSLGK